MARGGVRPGAGRKAGKSANTSPVSRGRAHAREAAGNQRPWPADKVERWSIKRLVPYARNARTHSDEQVAQIAASIHEFGFTNPVLVDEEGTLIAGHGRVLGAQQLGITDVPTMVAPATRARARARGEAENQRPWPADKVERWSIDRLIPYARNARTHSDEQVAQIAASIREFGF